MIKMPAQIPNRQAHKIARATWPAKSVAPKNSVIAKIAIDKSETIKPKFTLDIRKNPYSQFQ